MALKFLGTLFGKQKRSQNADIFLYNTLRKDKERFSPIKKGSVGLYHCGPTVYGYQHIGNYRAYIFADLLKRMFRYAGYDVKQVINITDVGHLTDDQDQGLDKVEEGAKREHKTAAEIIKLYTDDFVAHLERFNIDLTGTLFPKATEHILEQIAFIKTLEEKGYTYKTSDGVYFNTKLFKNYGKLGKIDIEGLEEGKRVETNPEKKNPTDFALWKLSKPEERRQQEWSSPWGKGFPGWHIECSAMSVKYLGKHFDIHTGGVDHIPIHHNNEIAQSEAALNTAFVNYWMHVEHLRIDGKKISKSLGNIVLPSHIEERGIPLLAYRYWLLTSHYRTPINFTWEALTGAHKAFFRLERFFVDELGMKKGAVNEKYRQMFQSAIFDDLDTPKAIATVWNLIKDASVSDPDKKATLLDFDQILGLNLQEAQQFMESSRERFVKETDIPEEIKRLLREREAARKAQDYATADSLRDAIKKAGFEVVDTDSGSQLRRI